jgi:hypothetical protein
LRGPLECWGIDASVLCGTCRKRGRKPARDPKDTIRKLSEMTDEAEFEHLATAIRREATPNILSGSIRVSAVGKNRQVSR